MLKSQQGPSAQASIVPPPQTATQHKSAPINAGPDRSPPPSTSLPTEELCDNRTLDLSVQHSKYDAASSCDADDEEVVDFVIHQRKDPKDLGSAAVFDDDQPLDFSCKRKRGADDDNEVNEEGGEVGGKKWKVDGDAQKQNGHGQQQRKGEVKVKRKLLRKKREKVKNSSSNGGTNRIDSSSGSSSSFGSSIGGSDYDSSGGSSDGRQGSEVAVGFVGGSRERTIKNAFKKRRRRRLMIAKNCFDVDEHFRRSLGGVLYDQVVLNNFGSGGGNTNGGIKEVKGVGIDGLLSGSATSLEQQQQNRTVRVVIEDGDIKPSDVDDHFAKALGSETWSKIVNNTKKQSNNTSIPSLPPQPKSITPPPSENSMERVPKKRPSLSLEDGEILPTSSRSSPPLSMNARDNNHHHVQSIIPLENGKDIVRRNSSSSSPMLLNHHYADQNHHQKDSIPLKPQQPRQSGSSYKIEDLLGTNNTNSSSSGSNTDRYYKHNDLTRSQSN